MFTGSSGSISATVCDPIATFSPQSRAALKSAVDACLEMSRKGDCSDGPDGPITEWDVSSVTNMKSMFRDARSFNGEISKLDVSSVKNMHSMFLGAQSFNGDISKCDVSSVTDMNAMFFGAASFKQKLCGAAWVHSKASKDGMFEGSSGSISQTACTTTAAYSPQSKEKLVKAVKSCLKMSPEGDCSKHRHGPIGEWDVSSVTDMGRMFDSAKSFNGDISKWNVSSVTTMSAMFAGATSFNGDLSKWEVFRVLDISGMFWRASAFNGDISKWDVSSVTNMDEMFGGSTSVSYTHLTLPTNREV